MHETEYESPPETSFELLSLYKVCCFGAGDNYLGIKDGSPYLVSGDASSGEAQECQGRRRSEIY